MADHLPDDPRHWPRDPYELLGVESSASETDVKRAYTRLIRRFKPEHSPEQFRLIREAYEAALEHRKWYPVFPTEYTPPADDPAPVVVTSGDAPPESAPEPARPRTVRGPEDEAWALAVAGEAVEAYTRLVELARSRVESAELALRLYWLLAVHPALDADRTRHDWLATALVRSRLRGPAVELYRRELEADPVVALSERYVRLLEADANAMEKLNLARLRLAGATPIKAWHVVEADLAALAGHHDELDERAWLWFLVEVSRCAGFDAPNPAYSRCVDSFQLLRHLELRESWAFDQEEEHRALAQGWRLATAVPAAVREVVRLAWSGPHGAWRKALPVAAKWVRDDPDAALRQLGAVRFMHGCASVLTAFQRLLDESCSEASSAYPAGLVRGLVREYLSTSGHLGYSSRRATLLPFLVEEQIAPEELVQACYADQDGTVRWLTSEVRKDTVLRLAWLIATAVP